MAKKAFFTLIFVFSVCIKKVSSMVLKYEPPFSYGFIAGIDVFAHPQKPDKFAEDNPGCTKTQRFFPGGGLFFEYRLFNAIGLGLLGTFMNRTFANDSDYLHTKTITNNYCLDAAFVVSILPRGYGGVSFYAGPKMYFLLGSNCTSYTYSGEKEEVKKSRRKLINRNLGMILGFKIEVDRTGFIIGAEVEKFFSSMQVVVLVPELYENNEQYAHKKEKWQYEENLKTLSAFAWRVYIGYDFGRLHSAY